MLALLPVCAYHLAPLTLRPVGPAPREAASDSNAGCLMVYSAWDMANEYNSPVTHHTSYAIASDDGRLARQIQNHSDGFDAGPERVILPPGSYTVVARAATRAGKVTVPVIIEGHETTVVYLDGSGPNRIASSPFKKSGI